MDTLCMSCKEYKDKNAFAIGEWGKNRENRICQVCTTAPSAHDLINNIDLNIDLDEVYTEYTLPSFWNIIAYIESLLYTSVPETTAE